MRFKQLVYVCLWFLPELVFAQAEQKVFTLEQCIHYALENNVDVLNSAIDKKIASEQVQQTVAAGLPQVNGSGDLGYNFKIQQMVLPASFLDPTAPEGEEIAMPFGVPYTGNVGVSLSQMVFNGSYFVGLKAAKTYTELSRKDHIKTQIDVKAAVTKAYYAAIVNEERFELVKRNVSRLDSLLSDTKIMHEAGFVEKIDVSRINVQLNNAKVEMDNMRNLVHISRQLLKFQMGMSIDEEIILADTIEEIEFERVEEDYSENFETSERIEYEILQVNKDLVELDIANVRNQYYPQLYIYSNVGANTGRQELDAIFSEQWFSYGVLGLQLKVPIFDGFLKKNQIEEKKLQLEQINNSFKQLNNSIRLETEQAELNYKQSINNMFVQFENMQMAQEVYEVATIKYEEGVGSNIEIVTADADLKMAQTNYYNALYEALIAKVDLQKAYGELSNTEITNQ